MKKINKIIGTLVLAFFMFLSIDIVQAVAPPRLDNTNLGTLDTEQATLTITNVYKEDQFSAYKILDIYKNSATNEINYRYTDEFYAFLEAGGNNAKDYSHLTEEEYFKLTSGDITSGSIQTSSTLDVLVSDYAAYIKKKKLTGIEMTTNKDTSIASLTTTTGSYLVLPTKSDRVYAVMVGNLDYKEENGEWVKQDSLIVAKASDYSIKASIGKIGQKEASFTIGEEYTYFIELQVPLFPTNSTNKMMGFEGSYGSGIEIGDPDNIIIMNDSTEYRPHFIKEENQNGMIVSTYNILDNNGHSLGIYVLGTSETISCFGFIFSFDNVTSSNILISFKAKLKETMKTCRSLPISIEDAWNKLENNGGLPDSNQMGVTSGYDDSYNTPLFDGSNREHPKFDTVYAYTQKIQINKHILGDTTKKLGGAVFEIYSDSTLNKKVGTVTTDENGFAEFSGLGEGKYYLKEVTAPTGYSLLKKPTEIEIKYDESLIDSETGEYCGPVVDIANQKISALPITGGMGTILYTVVGILLIGSAGVGITYYKKKNRNYI